MKIAMVSPYDFTFPGGVGRHISQLSQELIHRGHDVQVLAPHSPSRPYSDPATFIPLGRSVPVPSGGSIARVSLSWWLYRKVRDILLRESFDIIHLHEPLAPVLPMTVLEFSNAVNVGTFHAYASRQHLYWLSHPVVKRWHRRLHGRIAVSPAAMRYISQTFPGDYKLIPNGIDAAHFGCAAPWPQFMDGKTNILFVGRMERRKGLRYLLDAYCRVKWEHPDIRLIVVGPGTPDKESHRILSARNPQDVVFTGGVSYPDLPRYYATADIFCAPATGGESFGIVLLEAMAAGKPVVAANIEGYNNIIKPGQQGLMFHRKDSGELAAQLDLLIRNPELRQRLGATGQRQAQRYDWRVVAGEVEDYYSECLEAARLNHACKRTV